MTKDDNIEFLMHKQYEIVSRIIEENGGNRESKEVVDKARRINHEYEKLFHKVNEFQNGDAALEWLVELGFNKEESIKFDTGSDNLEIINTDLLF